MTLSQMSGTCRLDIAFNQKHFLKFDSLISLPTDAHPSCSEVCLFSIFSSYGLMFIIFEIKISRLWTEGGVFSFSCPNLSEKDSSNQSLVFLKVFHWSSKNSDYQ